MVFLVAVYLRSSYQHQFTELDPRTIRNLSAWNWYITVYGEWQRLLTAMVLHAHPLHLLWNLLVLKIFGDKVEKGIGSLMMLVVLFTGGVMGATVHILISPNPVVGASGGICALMGLTLYWTFLAKKDDPMATYIHPWRTTLILYALLIFSSSFWADSVSLGSHLGGFAMGLLAGWVMAALKVKVNLWRAFVVDSLPKEPEKEISESPFPRYEGNKS